MADVRVYGKAEELAELVRDLVGGSFRSYRRDRVCVVAEFDTAKALKPVLDADYLFPDDDHHWSGIQRLAKSKAPRRILVGDYVDWFCWFMRSQRFRAFHTVVLVDPVGFVVGAEFGGYLDGLFARLRTKPVRIIVLETPELEAVARAWAEGGQHAGGFLNETRRTMHLRQMVLATLYGTRLQWRGLRELLGKTLYAAVGGDVSTESSIGPAKHFVERNPRTCYYRVKEGAKIFVEGLAENVSYSEPAPKVERLFESHRPARKPRLVLPDPWLRSQVVQLISEQGRLGHCTDPREVHLREAPEAEEGAGWGFRSDRRGIPVSYPGRAGPTDLSQPADSRANPGVAPEGGRRQFEEVA